MSSNAVVGNGFACSGQAHTNCIREALAAAERVCRQRGLRLTPLRRRVLELVWGSHQPIGAYPLLEKLQMTMGRVAPPTVYRALDFLQAQGLVHRLASLNAFIGCVRPGTSHTGQFLICASCRALAEIDDPQLHGAIAESAEAAGFEVRHPTIEVLGLCPACREQEEP
jgi:Fur family zinc uptake transcriptional regulator